MSIQRGGPVAMFTVLLFLLILCSRCEGNEDKHENETTTSAIIGFNWSHVQGPYLVCIWLVISCIAKICFHISDKIGEAIPDSALLIGVGLALGFILNVLNVSHSIFYLPSEIFFLFLLPPIIFDAGYFMPVRATLAVCAHYRFFTVNVTTEDSLLFSSLISAVDPVAVITVFEEMHVNEFLFINVFGEALFNDGIAAVLFQIFKRVALIRIPNLVPLDYVSFTGSFFAVALGGVAIGIIFAFICAAATRYTDKVAIVGPAFVFIFPYLAYLTAEMFGLSAILAICTTGIVMKQYVKGNMTHEAAASVKYFVKMLSQSSETAVFMFLGLSTMSSELKWDVWFIIVTLMSCLVFRALGVILQCTLLNIFRTKRFTLRDQFVMSYGGLRGAIAFGLLSSVPDSIPAKDIFTSTTLVVILFTAEKKEETMAENVFNKYFDYIMAGVEDVVDQHSGHSFKDWFERMNARILKPLLIRNAKRSEYDASAIVRAYHKIALQDALNTITQAEDSRRSPSAQSSSRELGFTTVHIDTPTKAQKAEMSAQGQKNLASIVNQLLDRRLSEFRQDPLDGNAIDDIPDDIRPRAPRSLVQPLPVLPGMSKEASKDLGQRITQWRRTSSAMAIKPKNNLPRTSKEDPGTSHLRVNEDPNPSNQESNDRKKAIGGPSDSGGTITKVYWLGIFFVAPLLFSFQELFNKTKFLFITVNNNTFVKLISDNGFNPISNVISSLFILLSLCLTDVIFCVISLILWKKMKSRIPVQLQSIELRLLMTTSVLFVVGSFSLLFFIVPIFYRVDGYTL
ncbi:Sodium/hydrogen exchanger [Aphelenchoides bicaudatus]|nr:Sodium/hydrogen exchanger [Aphelenchoides bicaudatus]